MLFPSCVQQLERDALLGRPVSSLENSLTRAQEASSGYKLGTFSLHILQAWLLHTLLQQPLPSSGAVPTWALGPDASNTQNLPSCLFRPLTREPQPARKKANSTLPLLTPTWLEGPCLEWVPGPGLWRASPGSVCLEFQVLWRETGGNPFHLARSRTALAASGARIGEDRLQACLGAPILCRCLGPPPTKNKAGHGIGSGELVGPTT